MRFRVASVAFLWTFAMAQPHANSARSRAAAPQRDTGAAQAAAWMKSLTLRDRIAQLILMPCYGEAPSRRSSDYKKFRHWVFDLHVGGFIVNNRIVSGQVRNAEPHAMALFLNQMQKMSRLPLLVGGDFERGASMRVANTVKFPHNMAYGAAGDLEQTRFLGAETAREARALGVHWIYAPDADVNNNPDNPIINIRSFGEDPKMVAAHVRAFIRGAREDSGVKTLVTVKHFPGHGDTSTDSHMNLARIDAPRERMESVELVPFKAAIEENVDSVMTGHLAVPAFEPEEIPATVSKNVITGLLREQLGFKGIVVTDAMDMQGLAKLFTPGEAAVRALEAGVDVLLMPTDPDDVIKSAVAAVRSGRLSAKRIDDSVRKVLTAKARLGLARNRMADLDGVSDGIENEEAEQHADQVANRALTLVKNTRNAFPFANPERSCIVVLAESRFSQEGRRLIDETRRRSNKVAVRWLDPSADPGVIDDVVQNAAGCDSIAVAAFVSASAYRGNVALPGGFPDLMTRLIAGKAPVTMIAFGNPYLLRNFPDVAAYLAAFSTTTTSEAAVARALFGEIPISGRMPVSIPGFAKIGDGIQTGAVHPVASN